MFIFINIGIEYSAVVELSSYQAIPREVKKRKDPKSGTIVKGILSHAF